MEVEGRRLVVGGYRSSIVGETVFPNAFSPFAVKRCSIIGHTLAFVSRVVVNVKIGSGGGA